MASDATATIAVPRRSAWLNVAAKIAGAGCSLLVYVMLARISSTKTFSDVAVTLAWVALATTPAALGVPLFLVRYVAEAVAQRRFAYLNGLMRFSFGMTLGAVSGVALLAALPVALHWVPLSRDLQCCVLLGAALLPPSVLLQVVAGVLQGLKRVVAAELLMNVLRPALVCAVLGGAWFAGERAVSVPAALGLYIGATVLALLACLVHAVRVIPRAALCSPPSYDCRAWLAAATRFMVALVAATLADRVDLLTLGWTGSAAQIAVYAVATRFSQTLSLANVAIATAMGPYLAESLLELHAGRAASIQRLVRDTARTTCCVCLAALIGFATIAPAVLTLFGTRYSEAYGPLMILLVGQSIGALLGPAGAVATFAGAPQIVVVGLAVGTAINVSFNMALVPAYGTTGAAIATAFATVSAALVTWAWTRRRFAVDTCAFVRFDGDAA